ncbi:MAG: hypothetical protein ACRD23_15640 [Terriglobales bacterium]
MAAIAPDISQSLTASGAKTEQPQVNEPVAEVLSATSPRLSVQFVQWAGKPARISFGNIRDPRLRVREPIPVNIREEGGSTLAVWDEINEFGQGDSISEALDDLAHTVAELYLSLAAEQNRLGSDLQAVWRTLDQHVTKR